IAKRADPDARHVRSREETAAIDDAIYAYAKAFHPVICRQIYYDLVTRKIVEKDEANYKLITHRSARMREAGRIPYGWIAAQTRSIRRPNTYTGVDNMLRAAASCYRCDRWDNRQEQVTLRLEQDSPADVF